MPLEIKATGCCGMFELNGISTVKTPEEVIDQFWPKWFGSVWEKKPFLLFSGVTKPNPAADKYNHANCRSDNYGQALADYIRSKGWGEVVETGERANTSYMGNIMKVWVWAPDWDRMGYDQRTTAEKERRQRLADLNNDVPSSSPQLRGSPRW